ncbi:MAG: UDP-N-acetylglucosamine 4,6-dehydratase (inverting) [Pseudomonadota bacterium]
MTQQQYIDNTTVLVTGGTGSFGQAFVKSVFEKYSPRELVVFSRDEFKQSEMAKKFPPGKFPIRYYIGDIRDRDRLLRAFNGVDVVIHAAALKQVPALENNPFEAVKTNILGVQNIIEAALDRGVKRVVGVSTDKAVSPTNLYGATKLSMEKLLVAANNYVRYRDIRFTVVRYGNVIGSRGSVIPHWCEMIANGATRLPLTSPEMTRFVISLDEGVDLVIRALNSAAPGEVFVPKIPSIKMADLAKVFPPHVEVDVVGIRPGEKLHESLIGEDEGRHTYDDGSHYIIAPEFEFARDSGIPHAGTPVPKGFFYRSDLNTQWLDADAMRPIVKEWLQVYGVS